MTSNDPIFHHSPLPVELHTGCVRQIYLADITQDATLQVRQLDISAVSLYAAQMASGIDFDPVVLADVDGILFLVDGWHRIAAHKKVGRGSISARVRTMSREDSIWAAATANMGHGVPLKKKDHRRVFNAFIKAGRHRVGKGGYIGYRAIAEALQTGTAYTTVRNWMKADHRSIYEAMGDTKAHNFAPVQAPGRISSQRDFIQRAHEAADSFRQMTDLLACPYDRSDVIVQMEATLVALRLKPHEPRPVEPVNNEF